MSTAEFKLRKLLEDATFFIRNAEEDESFLDKCKECMDSADLIIRQNTRESFIELSPEVIVMFCEVAILTNKRDEDAQRVLDIFFQRVAQEDQFFCRALLAYATLEERKIQKLDLKAEENLKQVMHSYSFIKRALDIATKPENKQKYQFIVYNASIKTWHIVRSLLKQGWSKNLVEILEKISNLLEEADDSDFNWRCRYLLGLVKAMFDAEKKPEALKVLDKLWDLTKKKGECKFQEVLFRNRVHFYRDNQGALGGLKKETETGEDKHAFRSLFIIQQIKSGVLPETQIEKELTAVMAALAPQSVNNDPNQAQQSSKIAGLLQDRLAECGRLAIKHNLVQLCEGTINVIGRARQGSLRAKVWTEYSKAELLIKKPASEIDKKSGMKMNTFQKQIEDFERRVEALKILDRAMIANKRLQDADIIIEGCTLIWNIGLPFLKKSTRHHIYKPFSSAAQALEQIQANENLLRVCLHFELAKFEIDQDFLSKATNQLKKALDIDYSLTMKQVPGDLKEDDDPSDFQRPYQKVVKFILKKLNLRTNLYGGEPESVQEQIMLDVENAKTTKNQKMRETLLDKALKELSDYDEPEFSVDPSKNMVEEEIQAAKKKFFLQQVRERKERVLIGTEIAKLAMEEMIIGVAFEAAELSIKDEWDHQKNTDLVIAQGECNLILAKCYVEYLLQEEVEIGFKDLITIEEDQDMREFTNEDKLKYQGWKVKFTKHVIQAVKLGQQAGQSWLVFNGAIEFWNSYLPVFKKPNFFELIHQDGVPALIECFEGMNNCFITASFSPDNVDYELDKKMQVFANLSMVLSRIYEFLGKNDDCVRTCDILLQKQLPSHLRKTFDSIRARVTKSVSALGAGGAGGKPAPGGKPGAKDGGQAQQAKAPPSRAEITTSEVLSYLELIQNGNKDMIQKAVDSMNIWQPNPQEEIELELNAELWCRLGRLAINQNTNAFTKIALYCSEACIKNGDDRIKKKQYQQIPVTRIRWYAVAESLYGESLQKLIDTQKQEKESIDKLLHISVSHYVESCNIACKATIGYLVLESSKSMWNALLPLLDQPNNRKLLISPMTKVHQYLKSTLENSDPDFLVLFYSALFTCIQEQKDWKLGETITEEAFNYMPNTHQKVLWEAKMLFMSKLGKNVLNAISNMKENNASLMAKVWVKYARSSSVELEQHSAYNKAIEILRKEESVEVVEVLIEYAEWLQRHKYQTQDVEDQLLLAIDLLMDIEPGWDDEDDEQVEEGQEEEQKTKRTKNSRSSKMSKQSKAKTKMSRQVKSIKQSRVGGQSKKSLASRRSTALKSKAASRYSKKTTTALSKRQEEEAQPPFLNCSHFEKLVRISSMLAMIAPDSYKQREYALDAHFFVMKLWEQSFQTINAMAFFEEHKNEVEELGFNQNDVESRRQYFAEIFTNNEINIPIKFALPEKAEDWVNFTCPKQLSTKSKNHEDKIMVAKWTFVKPELTYYHLQNVLKLLEDHYFTIQALPVLEMINLFSSLVLEDKKLSEISNLKKARIMLNLGLKEEGEQIKGKWETDHYKLTDEEKKTNLEKIKALKDPADDLKDKNVQFQFENEMEPKVLESIRIHEVWIQYAEELLRWGEFIKAKDFIMEANLHARILKDQDNYSKSLMFLSSIAFVEGEGASALRCDMLSHQYAKDMGLVESCILHTFDLLKGFNKIEDCANLINPCLEMLTAMKDKQIKQDTQSNTQSTQKGASQNNLPLEFALGTIYLLKAILSVLECNQLKDIDDQKRKLDEGFQFLEGFEVLIQRVGYKQLHLILLLKYAYYLQQDFGKSVSSDYKEVEFIKIKLERTARILLRIQELLTNQVYYIGIHLDSNTNKISLPLVRFLGITKLRIAQVNTAIGLVKNAIKLSSSTSSDPARKLEKVVATFMDAITKQIEAQTNTYKSKMNRYEKSISILYSALNMIHPKCEEYVEALVEIARCRRLLALNKKHLRGQWRQDAEEVDKVNLKLIKQEEEKDRKDQLEEKGLEGEVKDIFIDYKEEALKTFIDLLEGKTDISAENEDKSIFLRILERLGKSYTDNILATFSLEYAEARGNLNKEQAFFYMALYQFAVSRQFLIDTYLKASTEKHPDVLRLRHIDQIQKEFTSLSSPYYPKGLVKIQDELKDQSKPFKIANQFYNIEDFKENLPHSSAYLVIQLSEDKQSLYYGMLQITKERKHNYYVSKLNLTDEMRDKLFKMTEHLAQSKIALLKTPITIQEDLDNLERDGEETIAHLMSDMEIFFQPLTEALNKLINPELKGPESDEATQQQPAPGAQPGKAAPPKKEEKKAPAKAPAPAKGGAKGGELASYESNLPLPTSGIESLVLLIDNRIESLPFESLSVFCKIPVVCRDFNLHLYMNRLKSVGHQAPLHNNTGISKENLRYIVDSPQPIADQSQQLMTQDVPKLLANSKWEGILTKQNHIPSEGEWQRLISQSSLFAYFSMTCLLHKFPPALVSDLSIFSKCRAMIIMDRMNTFKTLVERTVLTSKHFMPNEQPCQQVVLFSLCGISSIVTNHWAVKPESNLEIFDSLLRTSLSEQVYIGAALRKFKEDPEGQKKKLFKNNMVTYGVPLLRIV